MKALTIAILCALFVGCEYTVPLVTKPAIKIDKAVLGVWQGEEEERLLVLPLGETEYLVSFPAGSKNAMFARACLGQAGEEQIVQLRWFGTAQGDLADEKDPNGKVVYQYAKFSVVGDVLAVHLLNTDVVPKSVASAKELRQAITQGMDHPELFREPMRFQRMKK